MNIRNDDEPIKIDVIAQSVGSASVTAIAHFDDYNGGMASVYLTREDIITLAHDLLATLL